VKHQAARTYACAPNNVGAARAWLTREVLGELPQAPRSVLADVELLASELVTNAVRAGGDELTVTVRIDDSCVCIGVADLAPGRPAPRAARNTDANGRGLAIVTALADEWGVRTLVRGKEVWASVRLD
jgi:anti-sigma regulatory factor (Ser/Thr protein kinase)